MKFDVVFSIKLPRTFPGAPVRELDVLAAMTEAGARAGARVEFVGYPAPPATNTDERPIPRLDDELERVEADLVQMERAACALERPEGRDAIVSLVATVRTLLATVKTMADELREVRRS